MAKMQAQKGGRGEREFAVIINDLLGVVMVRRAVTNPYQGGHDLAVDPSASGEVAMALRGIGFEIKRRATVTAGDISHWWQQCADQAGAAGLIPVLAYRGDRQCWRVVVAIGAFVDGLGDWAGDHPFTVTMSVECFAVLVRENLICHRSLFPPAVVTMPAAVTGNPLLA